MEPCKSDWDSTNTHTGFIALVVWNASSLCLCEFQGAALLYRIFILSFSLWEMVLPVLKANVTSCWSPLHVNYYRFLSPCGRCYVKDAPCTLSDKDHEMTPSFALNCWADVKTGLKKHENKPFCSVMFLLYFKTACPIDLRSLLLSLLFCFSSGITLI